MLSDSARVDAKRSSERTEDMPTLASIQLKMPAEWPEIAKNVNFEVSPNWTLGHFFAQLSQEFAIRGQDDGIIASLATSCVCLEQDPAPTLAELGLCSQNCVDLI